MKLANQICLVVLFVLSVVAVDRGCERGGSRPSAHGADRALITFEANKPPVFLDNDTFWNSLDSHFGHDNWRKVPSGSPFGDDQPEFKALQQAAKDGNSIVFGKGETVIDSEPLPADEATTEKLIGKYSK